MLFLFYELTLQSIYGYLFFFQENFELSNFFKEYFSFPLSWLYLWGHLSEFWPTLPQTKNLKGSLPLNLPVPSWSFFTKFTSSSYGMYSNSLHSSFCFPFVNALSVASLTYEAPPFLISKVVRNPWSWRTVRVYRSLFSSMGDTFDSNLGVRDLKIFSTEVVSFIFT